MRHDFDQYINKYTFSKYTGSMGTSHDVMVNKLAKQTIFVLRFQFSLGATYS